MGEDAADAVELSCPGCGGYFRLKPRGGSIPQGVVPCPKCMVDIPVAASIVARYADEDGDKTRPPFLISSPSTKTPMQGQAVAPKAKLSKESTAAIAEIEGLTMSLPGGAIGKVNSTFTGRPGANPFTRNADQDKTASVQISDLERLTLREREEKARQDQGGASGQATSEDPRPASGRDTVPRGYATSTPAPGSESPQADPTIERPLAVEQLPEARHTLLSHDAVPRVVAERRAGKQSHPTPSLPMAGVPGAPEELGVFSTVKKDKLRARLERKRKNALQGDPEAALSSGDIFSEVSEQSGSSETSDPVSSEALLPERPVSEVDEREERQSLASLFQQVRARHADSDSSEALELPVSKKAHAGAALPADLPASRDTRENVSAAKAFAETTRKESEELSEEELEAILANSEDLLVDSSATSHDGLFADLPRPSGPAKPGKSLSAPPIPTVSNRPGRPTSGSMLARLQKRREQDDAAQDEGQAGEARGSGYIRLPTTEIQEVLGRGSFRLRIEGVIYEPVDIAGLTQLIKGGVLLGAEEIAEADGDWSPVSEHSVFDELRRRMAAEAHALLSSMGQIKPGEDEASEPLDEDPSSAAPKDLPEAKTSEEDAPLTQELDDLIDSLDELPSPPAPPLSPRALPDILGEPPEPMEPPSTLSASVSEPEPGPDLEDKEDSADVEGGAAPAPAKKSKKGTALVLTALGALATALGVAMFLSGGLSSLSGESSSPETKTTASTLGGESASATASLSGAALLAAMERVEQALPLVLAEQSQHLDWARQQLAAGNAREAALLLGAHWDVDAGDGFFDLYTEALLAAGEYRRLRTVAIEGMQRDDIHDKARGMFAKSISEDQALGQNIPIAIGSDTGLRVRGLETIEGVDRLIVEDGSNRFVFKPAQPNFEEGWRIEVATYRLCEAILCHFRMPQTRPARLERAALDAQVAQWAREDGERVRDVKWSWKSGDQGEFVEGSLQELISHDAVWPIEDLPLWREWLSVTNSTTNLEQPLAEHIDRVRERSGQEAYERLLGASEGASTADIARQVSDILTFDFLTNNWERFQTSPGRFGSHTPIVGGRILSIHNGEAFQPRSSRRVLGRFEWTSRYSQTMVVAIRALEPELINELLFPSPSAVDRVRLDVFWSQRHQVLQRVDGLIARHGEDKVLFFDSSP